ncbi:MAG: CppA family protein [Streptococcaceae bacterium]|jgi:catechol-2,3-dioxygenase|nr:CppA family protein [Streptococcaceae bacterium]
MVQEVLNVSTLKDIAIRVHDRDLMIDFYRNVLKMKLLGEENAVALFGGSKSKEPLLTLEETPSYRGRAVVGPKKLHVFQIHYKQKHEWDAIKGEMIQREIEVEKAWKSASAEGFIAVDPEGNRFSAYYGEKGGEQEKVALDALFSENSKVDAVEDFSIDYLKLNVPDVELAKTFYEKAFKVEFNEKNEVKVNDAFTFALAHREGPDLIGNVDELWDLEFIEIHVRESLQMETVISHFDAEGFDYFVDKKRRILTIKDSSGIEWWFMR